MTTRTACRRCHARRATLGLVHPSYDYLILLCADCYKKETTK